MCRKKNLLEIFIKNQVLFPEKNVLSIFYKQIHEKIKKLKKFMNNPKVIKQFEINLFHVY